MLALVTGQRKVVEAHVLDRGKRRVGCCLLAAIGNRDRCDNVRVQKRSGFAALVDFLDGGVVQRDGESRLCAARCLFELLKARAGGRLALQVGRNLRLDAQVNAHVATAAVGTLLLDLPARLDKGDD